MKHFKRIIILSIVLSTTACGGTSSEKKQDNASKDKKNETAIEQAEIEEETVEELEKEVVEIRVIAKGDDMSAIEFEPKALNIPANTRIKLTLENQSSAAGMLHNFVLVELGSGQEIASAGIKAGKKNGFIPKDDRVIAYTSLSNMGETVTVEFDTPAKGSYHYICTYPGHINMIGRLNVQ